MTIGHAVVRGVLTVTRIEFYVVDADDSFAAESWTKQIGRARHREMCKHFARYTREREEHVRSAFFVHYVVEERTEPRSRQVRRGISHGLNGVVQIELGGNRLAHFIE